MKYTQSYGCIPSGNNFCWNDLPNNVVSRFPKAVKVHMNNREPIYPPKIVPICEEFNETLYICIPENKSTINIEDNTNDRPLLTAVNR